VKNIQDYRKKDRFQNKKAKDIEEKLQASEPLSWNNIPIPVAELLTDLIEYTESQRSQNAHFDI